MSYRVLIVEDMQEILDNVCDFFLEEGSDLLEVIRCSDGSEAMDKVANEDFDLMILDIMLPGASGFDICRAARKKGDCPIILLTALGSESSILRLRRLRRKAFRHAPPLRQEPRAPQAREEERGRRCA